MQHRKKVPSDVRDSFAELLLTIRLHVIPDEVLDCRSSIGRSRFDIRGVTELLMHVAGGKAQPAGSDSSRSSSGGGGDAVACDDVVEPDSSALPLHFEIHSEAGDSTVSDQLNCLDVRMHALEKLLRDAPRLMPVWVGPALSSRIEDSERGKEETFGVPEVMGRSPFSEAQTFVQYNEQICICVSPCSPTLFSATIAHKSVTDYRHPWTTENMRV